MKITLIRRWALGLVVSIGWLHSGAQADDKPEWLSGVSKRFAPEFYLLGVGQGSSVAQANDSARAELAKTLRVSIRAQLASRQTVVQEKKGSGPTSEQVSSEAVQQVSSTTRVDLQGIEIAETWLDPVSKDTFSLAVLDRKKAELGLQKDLVALDREMMELSQQSAQAADVLARIGLMQQVKAKHARASELNQYLRVVSMTNKDHAIAMSELDVNQNLKRLQQSLVIAAVAEGGQKNELEESAKSGLAKAGFKVSSAENADYHLKLALKLEKPTKKDQWFWVRGVLTISLVEKANGTNRGGHEWQFKTSATDEILANQRAMAKVRDTLQSEELSETLLSFAGK
jgi:hypothetical protein